MHCPCIHNAERNLVDGSACANVRAFNRAAAGIVGFLAASGAPAFNDRQLATAPTYPCTIDEEVVVVNDEVMAGESAHTGTTVPCTIACSTSLSLALFLLSLVRRTL